MTEPVDILLVEDNEANQMLERAVLELEGFRVTLAASAPEAMEQISANAPDLILMDIQLPGEDGLSFTRRLKADPKWSAIPVVALTAHAMRGDRELAMAAGCVGYISKPINVGTFGGEVRQLLVESDRGRMVAG